MNDLVDGHVDVGREDGDEQRDQPPRRRPLHARHQQPHTAQNLKEPADGDQRPVRGQPVRDDGDELLRACEVQMPAEIIIADSSQRIVLGVFIGPLSRRTRPRHNAACRPTKCGDPVRRLHDVRIPRPPPVLPDRGPRHGHMRRLQPLNGMVVVRQSRLHGRGGERRVQTKRGRKVANHDAARRQGPGQFTRGIPPSIDRAAQATPYQQPLVSRNSATAATCTGGAAAPGPAPPAPPARAGTAHSTGSAHTTTAGRTQAAASQSAKNRSRRRRLPPRSPHPASRHGTGRVASRYGTTPRSPPINAAPDVQPQAVHECGCI